MTLLYFPLRSLGLLEVTREWTRVFLPEGQRLPALYFNKFCDWKCYVLVFHGAGLACLYGYTMIRLRGWRTEELGFDAWKKEKFLFTQVTTSVLDFVRWVLPPPVVKLLEWEFVDQYFMFFKTRLGAHFSTGITLLSSSFGACVTSFTSGL
jgi:hypothetical protein